MASRAVCAGRQSRREHRPPLLFGRPEDDQDAVCRGKEHMPFDQEAYIRKLQCPVKGKTSQIDYGQLVSVLDGMSVVKKIESGGRISHKMF